MFKLGADHIGFSYSLRQRQRKFLLGERVQYSISVDIISQYLNIQRSTSQSHHPCQLTCAHHQNFFHYASSAGFAGLTLSRFVLPESINFAH